MGLTEAELQRKLHESRMGTMAINRKTAERQPDVAMGIAIINNSALLNNIFQKKARGILLIRGSQIINLQRLVENGQLIMQNG